jgi:N-dimethylarginine dimethylaminohydrolase
MQSDLTALEPRRPASVRTARARRFLMCPPTHFRVEYSINPWMDPSEPVDGARAVSQWERLREVYTDLGHRVELIEPLSHLPDMVFSANGATVIDGRVLVARFRHSERTQESDAYVQWFRERGYEDVRMAEFVGEGEGDYLPAGRWLLAGTGFRTDRRSHVEAQEFFGRPVVGLTLVDARYYHLDTALAVLDDETIMYYPAAFSEGSRAVLQELFPQIVVATEADAAVFALNAVSDGRHVVLPQSATRLADNLRGIGFEPIGVDLSELMKAGGSVKCCTLELRD